jgi:hypothetical protein
VRVQDPDGPSVWAFLGPTTTTIPMVEMETVRTEGTTEEDTDFYILPEFQNLSSKSQRVNLFKFLSWSNLKRWESETTGL